jgi:hypothetical protein
MEPEKKRKMLNIIGIVTFPIWGIVAIALLYVGIIIVSILVGVLSLFGKNPLSFREIDFSNVEFDEF